jgi:hypothetical protein
MIVEIEIRPYGRVSLNVWGAITDDETKVFAEVQNNPFVPLVNANTKAARDFANAILQAADAADRAAEGLKKR